MKKSTKAIIGVVGATVMTGGGVGANNITDNDRSSVISSIGRALI